MKNTLATLLLVSSMSSAFADCTDAYESASRKRDTRNLIITAASLYGAGAGMLILPAASSAFGVSAIVSISVGRSLSPRNYDNNFDKLLFAFSAARSGKDNSYLSKIIERSIKKAKLEMDAETVLRAKEILVAGYENQTFCPVVKVKKNGDEKRAVFNKSALVDYLALGLGQ
jgi:hypothetical protein